MNFEEALRAELSLISGLKNKIYPLTAPEGSKAPYVVYVADEGLQDKSFEGYLKSKDVNCEINIFCDSYSKLKNLTSEVIEKLISFQGRVIGLDGPLIQNVTYSKPIKAFNNDVSLYICVFDIKVKI